MDKVTINVLRRNGNAARVTINGKPVEPATARKIIKYYGLCELCELIIENTTPDAFKRFINEIKV